MAIDDNGEVFPSNADAVGRSQFPYWPVDLTALRIPDDADGEAVLAAVKQQFTRRQYFFSAAEAYKALGMTDRPCWWHSVQLYAMKLRAALRSAPRSLDWHRKQLDPLRAKVSKLKGAGVSRLLGLMPRAQREELSKAEAALAKAEARIAELERLMPFYSNPSCARLTTGPRPGRHGSPCSAPTSRNGKRPTSGA